MSGSNCCFLTCIQVSQKAGKVVWYSYLFKNFPQFVVIYTVKGFSIVNEAEVDVFLEFPCLFYDPAYVGNLISDSSAFSKSSLYIWKFLVRVLLKPSLKDFEHNLASTWNECNCVVLWTKEHFVCNGEWSSRRIPQRNEFFSNLKLSDQNPGRLRFNWFSTITIKFAFSWIG